MTNDTPNLVLELLRRNREEMNAGFAGLREDMSEVKHRLSALEQAVGQVQSGQGQTQFLMGGFNKRMDRLERPDG
jgi:hypothetical protein